ncbi:hypothetical protein ABB37_03946 [Leptomonas pyrrhocoris]|uniref:Protein kinase domain-containing protein n=1 Tax=Leptomonas pyrrhocoris TaxID=157538 RepID=A0A0M9G3Q5_LEPPY|nr:hypothetical protein ABB37_03946 [Leptomonas pyrrhocoris]KPA81617.1 hypothetical protein ABB37_03946 [Leptomonas pyrrhocoris]|eukprot:XP_015660056.1 hypothetical protein ABB37_03946 [Leptomonas pyrrhocoris]
MHAAVHDAPPVRSAPLLNSLETYFVAPFAPTLGDPTSNVMDLAHPPSNRTNTELSLPRSLLSSLAIGFDRPVEDAGPGLRRIVLPTPPPRSLLPCTAQRHRRRPHRTAVQASATAAASRTLRRQQQPQQQPTTSSRRHPGSEFSLEAWQPLYLCVDSSVSADASIPRKTTKVTSPHPVASTPLAAESRPSAKDGGTKGATKSAWRLRRCGVVVTGAPGAATDASPISGLLDRSRNPLDVLRQLGAATVNDAPLCSFLPILDLRLPSSRSSTGAHNANTETYSREAEAEAASAEQSYWHATRDSERRRRRSYQQRTNAVAVHLGDVEACTFRVEVAPGEASPVQAVVDAYHECAWDGMEFLLLPLTDEPDVSRNAAGPSHFAKDLAQQSAHDKEGVVLGGGQAASLSFNVESQIGLGVPGMPVSFLRSANDSFPIPGAGGEVSGQLPLLSSAAPTVARANVINDAPACGRTGEGLAGDAGATRSVVPCWKRFSTTAALYLTLGDAGCFDTAYFPFSAVQLCTWGDLVAQPHTRIEMMACHSATAMHTLQAARSTKATETVPVAVMFPTTRKGVVRHPFSLTTQPFNDAEVFQLFYLQLIFRAYFDIRFPALGFRLPGRAGWQLRSHFIAVRSSGNRGVAFEHPLQPNEWIRFPTHTRLLTLLCLKEAIVPLYATPAELQESAALPLFGAGDALPCLGALGHAVAQWAATVVVTSPASAMAALAILFDKMGTRYGCTRVELWNSCVDRLSSTGSKLSKAPLLFRCGVASVGSVLDRHGGTLARFFVPPEKRGLSVPFTGVPTDTTNVLQGDAHTVAELSTTLSTTSRQTHPLYMRREDSTTSTMLPTLNDVVLDLNALSAGQRSIGVTDLFSSTTGASSVVNQSRTNAFSSTYDVVHQSTLPTPTAEAATDTSKPPCTSSTATGDVAPGGTLGSSIHPVAVPSYAEEESNQKPVKLAPNTLLSSSEEALEAGESGASAVNKQAERAEEDTASAFVPVRTLSFVGSSSPFTGQESLVTRWRYYTQSGNCSIFDGTTAGIQLFEFLGRGGSGVVYRGTYGSRHLPVAVKVLIIPDGMSHEHYVRESLTDVAFYVLANQLNDYGISYNGRAHDFIVSSAAPAGLPAADAAEARRGGDPATTKLCYFVTDLMDGTIGRFLDSNDADFDPMYDQLANSALLEGELFQFLFHQLTFRTLFDWRVLDLMLNNQLRGDNIGYRYVGLPPERAVYLREHPEEAAALTLARQYYAGLLYAFQFSPEERVKYLRFPAISDEAPKGDATPLRFICMIDLGQGVQPNTTELVRRKYIGETVVESCMQDDGFGRFWPLDELYCRCVEVKGELSSKIVAWGSKVRINSQEDAFRVLQDLFLQYYPTYGVVAPTEEELRTYLCLSWTPSNVTDLKTEYVYREE